MFQITLQGITAEEVEPLLRPVNGQGGFQSLLRRLQRSYSAERGEVCLSDADIEAIVRYSTKYGQGGFQDRLGFLIGRVGLIVEQLEGLRAAVRGM